MASTSTRRHFVSYEERTQCSQVITTREADEPFFAVYQSTFSSFLGLGPSPRSSIELALEKDYPFAHEAGVYFPDQDAVFVTSNRFTPGKQHFAPAPQASSSEDPAPPRYEQVPSDDREAEQTIWVSKLSRLSDGSWTCEKIDTDIVMGNGGINYRGGVLFCDQGSKTRPGGLKLMEAQPPYVAKTLIEGFHGRLFNSVNDVVVHTDGSIWFTDPIYGYEQGFRNKPQLPCQVYRFTPNGGNLRVVADGFGRPNGLCFSPDEKTMYITDTDYIHGDGTTDPMRPSTIYAFDVIVRSEAHFLANRRVFAMADNFVPDGIKCDTRGNVYSGCGDGISIWNAGGLLIGKIVIPGGVANFCFGRKGEIFCLNETRFWVVKLHHPVQGALLANMGIKV